MAELWKSALRNTYAQNGKIKIDKQHVEKKNVLFWKYILFCNNLIDQSKKKVW